MFGTRKGIHDGQIAIFTLSIGTSYLLTLLLLKEIVHSLSVDVFKILLDEWQTM